MVPALRPTSYCRTNRASTTLTKLSQFTLPWVIGGGVPVAVAVGVGPGVAVAVGVAVGVTVAVAVGIAVAVAVAVAVGVGVAVAVAVDVGVDVAVSAGIVVGVAVEVAVGIRTTGFMGTATIAQSSGPFSVQDMSVKADPGSALPPPCI